MLCHRTGEGPEVTGHQLAVVAIRTVSCTACVLSHRTGEAEERKQRRRRREGGKVTEENFTTTTLTVGKKTKTNDNLRSPGTLGSDRLTLQAR